MMNSNYKENKMSETNEIKLSLTEDNMYNVQNIANILEMTVEDMAEDALLSYAYAIEKKIKRETRNTF